MKKLLYVLFLMSGMVYANEVHYHTAPIYPLIVPVNTSKPEPDYYSRQWLYQFAREHGAFAHAHRIQDNLTYYIKLVTTHIEKLAVKIEQGDQSTSNKLFKGVRLTALGSIMLVGGSALIKYTAPEKNPGSFKALLAFVGVISAITSIIPLILGPKALYKSIDYTQRLQNRLVFAQYMLRELQAAQTA